MIQIQISWAQRVAGVSCPILKHPTARIPHLNNEKWTMTLHDFLSESELGIRIQDIRCPIMKRENDCALMDIAIQSKMNDGQIRMVNCCRVYLCVECLSDICSADGKRINPSTMDCKEEAKIATTEDWPRQPRPGKQHRKTWKKLLESISNNNKLTTGLGDWTHEPAEQRWEAYYDPCWDVAITKGQGGKWMSRRCKECPDVFLS